MEARQRVQKVFPSRAVDVRDASLGVPVVSKFRVSSRQGNPAATHLVAADQGVLLFEGNVNALQSSRSRCAGAGYQAGHDCSGVPI